MSGKHSTPLPYKEPLHYLVPGTREQVDQVLVMHRARHNQPVYIYGTLEHLMELASEVRGETVPLMTGVQGVVGTYRGAKLVVSQYPKTQMFIVSNVEK